MKQLDSEWNGELFHEEVSPLSNTHIHRVGVISKITLMGFQFQSSLVCMKWIVVIWCRVQAANTTKWGKQ